MMRAAAFGIRRDAFRIKFHRRARIPNETAEDRIAHEIHT